MGIVTPMVYREAVALIAEHHDAGRDVVVVSTAAPNWWSRSPRCSVPTT